MLPTVSIHTGYLVIPVEALAKGQRLILPNPGQQKPLLPSLEKESVVLLPSRGVEPLLSLPDSCGNVELSCKVKAQTEQLLSGISQLAPVAPTDFCNFPTSRLPSTRVLHNECTNTSQERLCSVMKSLCGQSNWKKTLRYLASDEFKSFQADLQAGRVPNIDELVDKVTFRKRSRVDKNVNAKYMKKRNQRVNRDAFLSQSVSNCQDVFGELSIPPDSLANIFIRKPVSLERELDRSNSRQVKPKAPLTRVVHNSRKTRPTAHYRGCGIDMGVPVHCSGTIGTQTDVGDINFWLDVTEASCTTSQTQTGIYEPWMRTLSNNFLSVEALHMGTQTPANEVSKIGLSTSYHFSNMSTQTALPESSLVTGVDAFLDVSTQTKMCRESIDGSDDHETSICMDPYPPSATRLTLRNVGFADSDSNDSDMHTSADFIDIGLPAFGNCGTQTNVDTGTEASTSATQTSYDLLKGWIDLDIETISSSTQTQIFIDSIFNDNSNSVSLSHTETQTAFSFHDLLDSAFLVECEDNAKDTIHIETQTLAPGLSANVDTGTQTCVANSPFEEFIMEHLS